MRKGIFSLAFLLALVAHPALATTECDGVLAEGTKKQTAISRSQYGRLWLALKYSRKSYQETKKDIDDGLSVPGQFDNNYSERDFQKWQEDVRNTVDLDHISRDQYSILLSSGDKDILAAWTACITQRSGLFGYIEAQGEGGAVFHFRFSVPPPAQAQFEIIEFAFSGATIAGGSPWTIAQASPGINLNRSVSLKRINRELIFIHLSTTAGDLDAFLPYPTPIPELKTSPLEVCKCHLPNGLYLWGPKGEYCGGVTEYGVYSDDCRKNVNICRCIGEGGTRDINAWGPQGEKCFGVPEYTSSYAMDCQKLSASDLCACKAGPSNIGGIQLWGPANRGFYCGGIQTWNAYGPKCARP